MSCRVDASRPAWLRLRREAQPRMGFFTDTSSASAARRARWRARSGTSVPDDGVDFPGESYDNTGALSADTWRHVAFIEQQRAGVGRRTPSGAAAG